MTLPEGQWAEIMPLTFGRARIIVTDVPSVAVAALSEWEANGYEGEPSGWMRHPFSGRRRPDGDASREYVMR